MKTQLKIAIFLLFPAISLAQVPVDEDGNVIGQYEAGSDAVLLSATELEELVGPIALYPDDLLAIVLPASAYPLQIVEAARFLEAYENNSSLEPDENWDDSVVALTNYPEVIELLNDDLDWTLRLGDAVVAQQADVVSAVESFRDRAYAAGNLKSDKYQTISEDDGVIYIAPAQEDVIYVPYYEPARVVYYQPRPVYYYHPRAYPVYYYPYAAGHHFSDNYFWGVTTAFTIGWSSHSLHTWHHSYYGHPYYGRSYWNHWYRRPSIQVYNTYYTHNYNRSGNYNTHGDQWRPRERRREYVRREGYARNDRNGERRTVTRNRQTQPIAFRERDSRVTPRRPVGDARDNVREGSARQNTARRDTTRQDSANRGNAERRDRTARSGSSETQDRTERSGGSERQDRTVRSGGEERQDATARPRDRQRQETTVRPRERQRQDTTVSPGQDERPEIAFRQREPRRQETAVRRGVAQRQNSPTVRSRDTERRQPVVQSRNTQRQATVVRPRDTHTQQAPRRTSPSVQQPRQSEKRVRQREQPPQPAQQQSNDRASAKKSESRGSQSRSRSKERTRR